MSTQLALGLNDAEGDGLLTYEPIKVGRSTFLNGLATKVHRWFRLTPSYGPELVHEMIERLRVDQDECILDPFSGAGTTLIESKLERRSAFGVEINPLLHFVNEVSLDWSVEGAALTRELSRVQAEFASHPRLPLDRIQELDLEIPPIHNPHRWWNATVLVDLLVLRKAIDRTDDQRVRRMLRLALAGVLVPDLSNVTLGKLQLHFIDRSSDNIDVIGVFTRHVEQISDDLGELNEHQSDAQTKCFFGSSVDMQGITLPQKVDAIITSPPYPNRYSYVWNTRPHLYMLGMMQTGKQAADLDKRTIGGTWGTATSELSKGEFKPINKAVKEVVEPICSKIREQDNLMSNYVMHYFNRLTQQIMALEENLSKKPRLAYVVGNSSIKGVYVETDVMLGEILDRLGLGWKTFELHRFRKRHSGVNLYETIVYAAK